MTKHKDPQADRNGRAMCKQSTFAFASFYRPQPNDDVSLEKLNQSLRQLHPNSKSIIIVSGDFNLGHIDWTSSSIIPGKPNVKQHQDILDIIADHSLTQIVDKPTRNDKTLDLIITNYPSIVDNLETIPPIGEADHDILSLEITVSLRRCKHKPRQVLKYSKANWDNIKQDLKTIYVTHLYKTSHMSHYQIQ